MTPTETPPRALANQSQTGAMTVACSTGERAEADHQQLAVFLDLAAHEMKLPFDRVAARRCFGELRRELSDENGACEPNAIVEAAATAFGMKADLMSVSLGEAVQLIRPQAPLGLLRRNEDGTLGWMLLVDHRGRRVKHYDSIHGTEPTWTPQGGLSEPLRTGSVGAWLAFQPLLPCSPDPAGHDDDHGHGHHHGEAPLSRLLKLLSPDRSDIGVIFVFAIVIGLLALSSPIAVEALVNTVAFGQFVQPVVVLATILGVFLAFAAAMKAVQVYIAEIIQRRLFVRIAGDLAHRIPRVKNRFWDSHYGPEHTNRFFEVVTVQKVTTSLLLEGSTLLLQTLVGMAVIAFYHPVLLGFDAFLLLFIIGIIFMMGRGAVDTSVNESIRKYETAAWLEDLAKAPDVFASRSAIHFATDEADRRVTAYLTARMEHFRILMRQVVASLALQVIASTVLLGLGGWLVIRGELSLGQLVAAELIVTVIVGSFAKIGKFLEGYYDVMASMDKLGHLFDMPIERLDGVELPHAAKGVDVRFTDVALRPTPNGERLERASLEIASGQLIGLSGGSSSLRRQMLDVAIGRIEPAAGRIELDGIDLRQLSIESLRDQSAIVSDPEIIQGTVAENVHLGRSHIRESEVAAALQAVGLWDELSALPGGLGYRLATDGRVLSQDQKLRMTFARVLAGQPRLLLVDHSLDGLPDEALSVILKHLRTLASGCTVVIASGRSDVIAACDKILNIGDDGRVKWSLKALPAYQAESPRLLTRQD